MKISTEIAFVLFLTMVLSLFVGIPGIAFVYFGPWAGSAATLLSISAYAFWCRIAANATFLALLRGNLRQSESREDAIYRTMLAYRDRDSFERLSEQDFLRAARVFSICSSNPTIAQMWSQLVKKKRGQWLLSDELMGRVLSEFEQLREEQKAME